MTDRELARFRRRVWRWYRAHGRRALPWRRTRDPYRILVSEFMLQQTQVSRVVPKYRAWLKRYPTLQALARAPLPGVLRQWQGLGYNRRALYLHQLAQRVVRRHRGVLPRTVPELRQLPGVGEYTAQALLVLAFDAPQAMVETNIRKALVHEFFPRRRRVPESAIRTVAAALLDQRRPRDWNLALMDYGAAHFTAGAGYNPNRRTAGYHRQAPFAGSQRQLRGAVLRAALARRPVRLRELRQELLTRGLSPAAVKKLPQVMRQLVQEGFLVYASGSYQVAPHSRHHH